MSIILAFVAMLAFVAAANAGVMIKTSDPGGADCELREEQQRTVTVLDNPEDPESPSHLEVRGGYNRGAAVEAATQVNLMADNGTYSTGTSRTARLSYFKFNISGLPEIGDAFWTTNKQAAFQANVNNPNLNRNSRLEALRPGATSAATNSNDWNYTTPGAPDSAARVEFAVYGLDPNGVYANDPGGPGTRTDRSGHTYASTKDAYEWVEGTGNAAATDETGINFYDAPGITPHCMIAGSCNTSEYAGRVDPAVNTVSNLTQSWGRIDDLNSNALFLGTWNWPRVNPMNHLPVGLPMNFSSPALMDLVKAAKAAGRDSVTLIVADNMNPELDNVNISVNPNGLPISFFAFNYIMNPKEKNPMATDGAYDPDMFDNGISPDPTPSGPGPWSAKSNSDGRFAPKLYISVPEPASLLLVALGLAALAMTRRRK